MRCRENLALVPLHVDSFRPQVLCGELGSPAEKEEKAGNRALYVMDFIGFLGRKQLITR